MGEDKKFECKICKRIFDSYETFRRHSSRVHKIHSSKTFVDFYLNGEYPTCKCGCREVPRWNGHRFLDYRRGHISRIRNNWGHNSNALEKSLDVRKEQYKNGRVVWNKGIKMTDDSDYGRSVKKYSEKTHTLENREKRRNRMIEWLINNHKHYTSNLEIFFQKEFLDPLQLCYKKQFFAKEINGFYDFYIPSKKILIEVDGDFWHCNENRNFFPKYKSQLRNLAKDKLKNEWAEQNGYRLIQFWEYDIKNNRTYVKKNLFEECIYH